MLSGVVLTDRCVSEQTDAFEAGDGGKTVGSRSARAAATVRPCDVAWYCWWKLLAAACTIGENL